MAACLPVPELTVPAVDGFDAGCKALFANLFADNGSRSAIWIAALDTCPEGRETAIEVFELTLCRAKTRRTACELPFSGGDAAWWTCSFGCRT